MGVTPTVSAVAQPQPQPEKMEEKKIEKAPVAESAAPEASALSWNVYAEWGSVLERISEIKKSLSSMFVRSVAYRRGGNEYLIKLTPFFVSRLKSSESDAAIVRGVIAEIEGLSPMEVKVAFEPKDAENTVSAASDLDNI